MYNFEDMPMDSLLDSNKAPTQAVRDTDDGYNLEALDCFEFNVEPQQESDDGAIGRPATDGVVDGYVDTPFDYMLAKETEEVSELTSKSETDATLLTDDDVPPNIDELVQIYYTNKTEEEKKAIDLHMEPLLASISCQSPPPPAEVTVEATSSAAQMPATETPVTAVAQLFIPRLVPLMEPMTDISEPLKCVEMYDMDLLDNNLEPISGPKYLVYRTVEPKKQLTRAYKGAKRGRKPLNISAEEKDERRRDQNRTAKRRERQKAKEAKEEANRKLKLDQTNSDSTLMDMD